MKYCMIIRTVEVELLYWDGQFVKSWAKFCFKISFNCTSKNGKYSALII